MLRDVADRSYQLYWLGVMAAALIVGIGTGCAAESDTQRQAMPRDSVSQQTAQALVQSQQALRRGEYGVALAFADTAATRAPRLADAHFQRARVWSELWQLEKAAEAYRQVTELDAAYDGAWLNLGNNAYRRQAYREALRHYERQEQLDPTADLYVYMGQAHEELGDVDRAEALYRRAIDMDTSHAHAHALLGQLYDTKGNLEEALVYTHRALELEPDNARYRYAVGAMSRQMERLGEAVDHLKQVVEELPWHRGAHYNLGQALLQLGRVEEGQTYLSASERLEQLQSDIENLRSRARNSPDRPDVWVELGEKLRQSGQLDDAREAYSVAVSLQPHDPRIRNVLGALHSDLGQDEAALAHYRTLLQQHPTFADGWFNLGIIYARRGQHEWAEEAWLRTLSYDSNHQWAEEYLARLRESAEAR